MLNISYYANFKRKGGRVRERDCVRVCLCVCRGCKLGTAESLMDYFRMCEGQSVFLCCNPLIYVFISQHVI